ncbi:MAG TPA: GDP-mannose 4,6-dehydratase [candidate division Zixibacteria bacterium]|nr:GDP-mannose 4,6-dehydratase [candidate division Zixibacteria bacterium]
MKRRTAFITGIAGFAGSFLAEELLSSGYKVTGSVFKDDQLENISHLKGSIETVDLDILDTERCRKLLHRLKPDLVFHLAAFSSVGLSFGQERLTYRVNLDGTLNVLQGAAELGSLRKLVFISTSECYGDFGGGTKKLRENQPFNPVSPYGVSKAAAEYACRYYFSRHRLPVTISRSFNHSGPRQNRNFVIPSFCRQIAAIEANLAKPIMKVGDLSVKRDFSDVRDVVRGYRLLAEKGRPGEAYNLCSAKATSIETILNTLLKLATVPIKVNLDKTRFRKNDIPILRGDNSRAVKELGFAPRYNLKQTLQATLDYWRNQPRTQK